MTGVFGRLWTWNVRGRKGSAKCAEKGTDVRVIIGLVSLTALQGELASTLKLHALLGTEDDDGDVLDVLMWPCIVWIPGADSLKCRLPWKPTVGMLDLDDREGAGKSKQGEAASPTTVRHTVYGEVGIVTLRSSGRGNDK